jgi:hypothetical protein
LIMSSMGLRATGVKGVMVDGVMDSFGVGGSERRQ